ncbi:hypothetical protein J3L16_06695 [Alteromonas sp. 5E99-2]|nr:hypothetical protein [Alteromonas sp. 5E99-2]MBO1255370.1 hypothetical protein [Alteromonas sp. 5E99-2]
MLSVGFVNLVYAQSTPTEFAELSLEDLLNINIQDSEYGEADFKQLSVTYQFKVAEFEGYLDGDTKLSRDDVLFSPGLEERTNNNFPVVPTIIDQYVHILRVGYNISNNFQIAISIPYIIQETDHISSVEGYSEFLIRSEGLGDTVISTSYHLSSSDIYSWRISGGLSFPTGSIDEVGDTPRAPGDQQLPYTMQLGSGTFDIPLSMGIETKGDHSLSINLSAMIRTGRNDRNYRLGNNYDIRSRYNYRANNALSVFTGVAISYSEAIHGQDDELIVAGDFPYPASITNPALFGGKKISVSAGMNWKASNSLNLAGDFSRPVYQNLNGPQIRELWRAGIQLSILY